VDNGVVESSLSETLHGLSVESITEAHRKVLEGICVGKWWLSSEWTDSLTRPSPTGRGLGGAITLLPHHLLHQLDAAQETES
jgi:hypothetical protein